MNILLDVGAHVGETIAVALDGRWRFDHVHSFEPDPDCVRQMQSRFADHIAAGRLTIHPVALGAADGETILHGDNSGGGASVLADYRQADGRKLHVPVIDVNRFLDEMIPAKASLFVKLNCEGGEVPILDRLCDRGRIDDIASIMADFDVVKSSGGFYEKRRILRKARRRGLPISLAEEVMVGKTHGQRLTNWFAHHPQLAAGAAIRPQRQPLRRRIRYLIRDLRSALGGHGRNYR